ncbi:hypothetical protein TNCT_276641 [Trichonephila clavata]|uniref:Neurotransmitter-gated ion-channel ligand-binding domain-containing protein n=1 Tax=Trichonephila clavata TaxID=2740835 RepID=A0A8X6IAT7_TRICU|nr:hypothetical protein TNCT_276641 [Trichonephila clavata]
MNFFMSHEYLSYSLEDQECLDMLPPDYKKYEAPKQKGEPITVSFHLSITNIDEIDEGNMDFNLHGYLRATWKDERLFLNGSEIRNIECAEYIWTPSLRFRTVEKKETFDLRENLIYISENLTIYAQK